MPSNKESVSTVGRVSRRPLNGLPAYQRIQSVIRKRIESAQLHPGDPVPSERDLAKAHHVSLMTARHALASLEREGFVERRRGIGTFVAPPKIHFNKLMSYTEQMAARSLTAGSKVLFAKVVDNENEAAARLSLPLSAVTRFSEFSSATSTSTWAMPTKKLTLPPPIPASRSCWLFQSVSRFSVSARSFIRQKAKPSCMFWDSTARTGTTW